MRRTLFAVTRDRPASRTNVRIARASAVLIRLTGKDPRRGKSQIRAICSVRVKCFGLKHPRLA